ncbi:Dynein gamma chain, partial [Globisporangium splendens]
MLETFEPLVTQSDVSEFLSSPHVHKYFGELLGGKDTSKVFIHLQTGPSDASAAGGSTNSAQTTGTANGAGVNGPAVADTTAARGSNNNNNDKLCIAMGSSVPIRAKCCYFLRTTADGKPVDATKSSDNSICFGELAPNTLRDLETTIAAVFTPILKAKDEWGKADSDLKGEFMVESEKFANDLKEALNSMDSGLELRRPDRELIADATSNAATGINGNRVLQASDSPKLVAHYEDVLKEWCDVISMYLETNTTNDGKNKDEQIDDDGPMGELEYWRRRMQRLTSIAEQLKMNEYKDVFTGLSRTRT